jgi:hypothetical protein
MTAGIAAPVVRFPPRHASCVWLTREADAWLVLGRAHGWLHGDRRGARDDARWLGRNLGLPVREINNQQKGHVMAEYDNTNSGALFRNEDKAGENSRDYSGTLNVDGREFWVSGLVKVSKKGTKYLSLSLKPKTEQKPAERVPFDDEINF